MAASTSSAGEAVTMRLANGKTISWPATVAGKIEEGLYKVGLLERAAEATDRDLNLLEKQVEAMTADVGFELQLNDYCYDLEHMRKARQEFRFRSLSEVEERSLGQIRDLASSAIEDYKTRVGPVPAYDNPISLFSDTIPLELPESLAMAIALPSASHHKFEETPFSISDHQLDTNLRKFKEQMASENPI
ncbi:uncharacterized protein LOC100840093 isoform X3 [Brachypodium distachyon]|uniref:Uncharacterized protein n=1 Tax=Brachypodium distachyon TaxID=15368 RepID=A0A2K2CIA6_BRADI|nr:uncharacterized protein LOC100840093 isoform X3 [Brachypodium distachyon]PNT61768.1 hypothetical protein BRADI_5g20425v3 [Brachypodium distachyon]PNT61771.1 hypothetical protein BRADI_5g20425v3 [Brachypodium distachyon]PNT61773.1 hypothetical protein BRADI_5g20425v3 [Brachypodium distachyon]|eukprot:XP_024312023.1 uncharacterized protein LOC100840093 isoform X3 [Brachypodium distachyon]